MSKQRPVDYASGSVYQIHDHRSCPPMEHTAECPEPDEAGRRPRHGCQGRRPSHKCRGRWVGIIEAGWTAGGVRRRIKITGTSETDVKTKIRTRRAKIEAGGSPTVAGAQRTRVRTWAEKWIQLTQRKLRPNSQTANASAVHKWIIPTIGHKRIADLTPGDVRAIEQAIRKAGRTGSTAERVHGTLHKMLRDALVEGYPVPQRILEMSSPSRSISSRDAIPIPDALRILAQAIDVGPAGSRYVAALLQGMRPGEARGLTWACVDLKRQRIDTSWQIQEVPFEHGCGADRCQFKIGGRCPKRRYRIPDEYEIRPLKGSVCLVRPKTDKGKRIIPLVPWMTDVLKQLRKTSTNAFDLVWPDADGEPRDEKLDREQWRDLQRAARICKTPPPAATGGDPHAEPIYWDLYEARHTTATLLLELGVDEKVIEAIMGHTKITTTRGYQHVDDRLIRDALQLVAGRLGLAETAAGAKELPAA